MGVKRIFLTKINFMSTKTGIILTVGLFLCAAAWMGLPMSSFSETNPGATTVLKALGTLAGIFGIGAVAWEKIKNKNIF